MAKPDPKLLDAKLKPFTKRTRRMLPSEAEKMSGLLSHWDLGDDRLYHTFKFKKYEHVKEFTNRVMNIWTDTPNHIGYVMALENAVEVCQWTPAVHCLTEHDFIIGAKIHMLQLIDCPK